MHINNSTVSVQFRRITPFILCLLLILYAVPYVAHAGETGYGGIHLPVVETDPKKPTGGHEVLM